MAKAKAPKVLEDLTHKQDALLEEVFQEYDNTLDRPQYPDINTIKAWLEVVYPLYDLPVPKRVEVVASPFAAFQLAKELTGQDERELDWCGVADAGWVSFYDYFKRIGVLKEDEEECRQTLALRDFMRVAWDSLLLDECAIVVALPRVYRDEQGNLHNASGPCIEWLDGRKDWAWHGVWVPERLVMEPKSYTREEYMAITQTEIRRALGESAGWDHIVTLLGATSLDSWTDAGTGLSYELLGAATGERLLRKQSPALQSGAQPFYVEPVHELCRTARGARKWQATRLSPQECESDPELSYGAET